MMEAVICVVMTLSSFDLLRVLSGAEYLRVFEPDRLQVLARIYVGAHGAGYNVADPVRERLKKRGTELIAPYRSNNRHRRFEDKRKLRRYRKRWKIERTNAWLQNFRRIQVRYDRLLAVFQGFFHFACLLITLRHLCN
ncbi:transposase [Tunturiibacter gelidiferens]|uniref:transposase n=1 Tax=Tunturiibacter gelidiferens TaxID=3069689 RepID=UPI003D9B5E45